MEGLDLLKKEWNKQGNFPEVTENEIYRMIHQRSSSIVKWIFIISVIEIFFWVSLSVLLSDEKQQEMLVDYHLDTFMNVYSFLHWGVLAVFVFLFYKNFKGISAMSSAKALMKNIIKVRKIVKYYVWYNIIGTFIVMVIVWTFMIEYDTRFKSIVQQAAGSGNETGLWVGMGILLLVIGAVIITLLWLFYRIIYGILLKRLHKNYSELQKMEL